MPVQAKLFGSKRQQRRRRRECNKACVLQMIQIPNQSKSISMWSKQYAVHHRQGLPSIYIGHQLCQQRNRMRLEQLSKLYDSFVLCRYRNLRTDYLCCLSTSRLQLCFHGVEILANYRLGPGMDKSLSVTSKMSKPIAT